MLVYDDLYCPEESILCLSLSGDNKSLMASGSKGTVAVSTVQQLYYIAVWVYSKTPPVTRIIPEPLVARSRTMNTS